MDLQLAPSLIIYPSNMLKYGGHCRKESMDVKLDIAARRITTGFLMCVLVGRGGRNGIPCIKHEKKLQISNQPNH